MGQSQSHTSAPAIDDTSKAPPSSMESLIAEAAANGDSETESIDSKARKALECPCIADLQKGPCGSQFSEAFLCFLMSTAEEKGSDCVHPFVALQSCIKTNPNAFPEDIAGDHQVKETVESSSNYRIHPPKWSLESQSPQPRL
ncbi:mitochondrial intermembrane space import and assembly protein 40 homolog [Chenopodium quinoa]|nr:mitochondrial intermembrane space import and assembly protein 40 homolog [Chenopodium quinoa]